MISTKDLVYFFVESMRVLLEIFKSNISTSVNETFVRNFLERKARLLNWHLRITK